MQDQNLEKTIVTRVLKFLYVPEDIICSAFSKTISSHIPINKLLKHLCILKNQSKLYVSFGQQKTLSFESVYLALIYTCQSPGDLKSHMITKKGAIL